MRRLRYGSSTCLCLLSALALAVPSNSNAAWPNDPSVNVPVCTASGPQSKPSAVSDGAGGMIVAWQDSRAANPRVYVQRVTSAGTLWTANGVQLSTTTQSQTVPAVASDGAGGAIIVWQDLRGGGTGDIYAQRVNAAGAIQWGATGIVVTNVTHNSSVPMIVSDGAGGVIVVWQELSGADTNIWAMRINANGSQGWPYFGGVPMCISTLSRFLAGIVTDGAGGAYIVWNDYRAGANQGDTFAQHVYSNSVIQYGSSGLNVSLAAGEQAEASVAIDGAGGMFVTWRSGPNGGPDQIYIAHVNAAGSQPWAPFSLTNISAWLLRPRVVADGLGGAIVAWHDLRGSSWDIYAQRVSAGKAQAWPANGLAVCTASLDQTDVELVADGTGGAILTWADNRDFYDVYAQHIASSGAQLYPVVGIPVSNAASNTTDKKIRSLVSDGAGGAIDCWVDARAAAAANDIYAQRVDRFGQLGNAEPHITKVSDVLRDQGGHAAVQWTASYLDVLGASPAVTQYGIWRKAPVAAAALFELGAGPVTTAPVTTAPITTGPITTAPIEVVARDGRRFRALPAGAQTTYWEWLATQPARTLPGYSYVASTTTDSSAQGNARTAFMISAETTGGAQYWFSAPDSGYSVDNLAPAMPAPFTGAFVAAMAHLHWGPNQEPDFSGYRLYRGANPAFVPGPANLVASLPDTGYTDTINQVYYYKLSALDVHGNESPFAFLLPSGAAGVPPGGGDFPFALAPPYPNPGLGAVSIQYSVPQTSNVSVDLYDASGRRVIELVHGAVEAGTYDVRWDGRSSVGSTSGSGLYFLRMEVAGRVLIRKFTYLR